MVTHFMCTSSYAINIDRVKIFEVPCCTSWNYTPSWLVSELAESNFVILTLYSTLKNKGSEMLTKISLVLL
jgi:hypothetical protein